MDNLIPPLFNFGTFITLFGLSVSVSGALVLLHLQPASYLRADEDLKSVQCAHQRNTPRVGGLGFIAAMLFAFWYLVPGPDHYFFSVFAMTLMPVFLAGLAEDLGWRVSPLGRMLAAAGSALLAILLLEVWIPSHAFPGFEMLLGFAPLAIAITIIWAAGVCHAINLIDGVNGLAGGAGLLIATGLVLVAHKAGAINFAIAAAAVIPAIIGFLVFNWPMGRIFLGDAGAYSLGHILVWLAIGLAWLHPQVSALSLSLMFFWPVADTFLAIYRRARAGRPVSLPDRLHYHQLVMRGLILLSRGRLGKGTANSATCIIVLPLIAIPIAMSVYFWDRPVAALVAWAGLGFAFVLSYIAGIRCLQKNAWRQVRSAKPAPISLRITTH